MKEGLKAFKSIDELPIGGSVRRPEFAKLLGFSMETFAMFENNGQAPQGIRLTPRLIFYKSDEIRSFILAPEKWVLKDQQPQD